MISENVRAGRITKAQASLIVATRVLDRKVSDIARERGIGEQSVRQNRRRAEKALGAAIEL